MREQEALIRKIRKATEKPYDLSPPIKKLKPGCDKPGGCLNKPKPGPSKPFPASIVRKPIMR